MQDCIFCKIANREIPADIVYENEKVLVFKDINPAAPVHLLVIPKKHISTLFDLSEGDSDIMGQVQLASVRVARELNLGEQGFRLVCNCGREAGQEVMHIHYHLLAGRPFKWPPG
ncbi:MAG TPA: histidine triad nucleotide-binding protein [Bacillota bacterium]|jgi:histidine triad (HIT) family protein|nr:histidine triad nucleotide-binding protein [Peptococcaceae bacterium MAG4]NLW37363.1 histidine triad nucleotide-binding protein [Peptococcaceae bacterium]HPU35890.1 histidine triad nucleotide-binding protein [Bacillota bacterium]HPZ43868.1 histidine triad nucleotide-binding protein [Bacillota bacterium]HQD76369.1 histidine triad nucleotide-binding protein [Bacillota bacterium]